MKNQDLINKIKWLIKEFKDFDNEYLLDKICELVGEDNEDVIEVTGFKVIGGK